MEFWTLWSTPLVILVTFSNMRFWKAFPICGFGAYTPLFRKPSKEKIEWCKIRDHGGLDFTSSPNLPFQGSLAIPKFSDFFLHSFIAQSWDFEKFRTIKICLHDRLEGCNFLHKFSCRTTFRNLSIMLPCWSHNNSIVFKFSDCGDHSFFFKKESKGGLMKVFV